MTLADAPLVVIEVDRSPVTNELPCFATKSSTNLTSQYLETLGANTLENTLRSAEIQEEVLEYKALTMQKRPDIEKLMGSNELKTSAIQKEKLGEKMSEISLKRAGIRNSTGQIFTCDECGKTFGRKSHFTRHKKAHANLRPYICDVCKRGFNYQQSLLIHLQTHTGQRPYHCSYCEKSFQQLSQLKVHQRYHTGERPYTCEECGKSFINARALKFHKDVHNGPYPCLTCGRTFSRVRYLKWHEQRHVEKSATTSRKGTSLCSSRGKSLNERSSLKVHQKYHTGEKPHTCKECGKSFANALTLKNHKDVHGGPYQCLTCDQIFTRVRYLQQHEKHAHVEKWSSPNHKGTCNICGEKNVELTRHLIEKHSVKRQQNSGLARYECLICGKLYLRRKCVACHLQTHSSREDFQCDICGHLFLSRKSFQKHQESHIFREKQKLSCVICGEIFMKHPDLTRLKSTPPLRCGKCRLSASSVYPVCGIRMISGTNQECSPLKKSHCEIRCDICNKVLYSEYYRTRHPCLSGSRGDMPRNTKGKVTPKIVLIKEEVNVSAAPKDVFTFKIKDSNISIYRKDKENEEITLAMVSG